MPRTTTTLVQAILGLNYGPLPDGSLPDLQQYIDTATVIVDRVASGATAKGFTLTGPELELVERWLSAHCYCQMDPLYQSKGQGGASGSFQRAGGEGFESTDYGKQAVRLDYSGTLSAIGKRQFARCFWPGKTTSEQIDYNDRQ